MDNQTSTPEAVMSKSKVVNKSKVLILICSLAFALMSCDTVGAPTSDPASNVEQQEQEQDTAAAQLIHDLDQMSAADQAALAQLTDQTSEAQSEELTSQANNWTQAIKNAINNDFAPHVHSWYFVKAVSASAITILSRFTTAENFGNGVNRWKYQGYSPGGDIVYQLGGWRFYVNQAGVVFGAQGGF